MCGLRKMWERAMAAKIKRYNAAILKLQNALVDLELSYLSWDHEGEVEEGVGALGEDTTTLNKVGTEEAALGGKPEEEEAGGGRRRQSWKRRRQSQRAPRLNCRSTSGAFISQTSRSRWGWIQYTPFNTLYLLRRRR
jgi:hypothetical protein